MHNEQTNNEDKDRVAIDIPAKVIAANIVFERLTCRVQTGKKLELVFGAEEGIETRFVCSEGEIKEILREACGVIKSGRLTALLGPSGAGKTTLLNILAGRRRKDVSGRLRGTGGSRRVCVVPQDAALLGTLSARESLQFAADLKLDPATDQHTKEITMTQIADVLGISSVLDTWANKLSGGEKKRLAVALELVTDPPVMLLDEPTSGLDSVSSVQVISRIRQVAMSGRAVLVSVHQPSSRLFHLFDDVIVLSEGRTLYVGPVVDLVETFRLASFVCPNYYNAADFALEVASYENTDGNIKHLEMEARNVVTSHVANTENTTTIEYKQDTKANEEHNGDTPLLRSSNSFDDGNVSGESVSPYSASSWKQFIFLLKRASVCNIRDFHLAQMRLVCHIIVGLLLGAVYWRIGNDAAKINSNTSCIYFFLLFLYFANSMPNVHTFPSEAVVVFKEHLNNWYSIHSYFFSKILADLPLQVMCTTSFVLPTYFMTDQPDSYWRVFAVWFTCLIFAMQAQTFGLVSGTAFNMALGLFLVPAANIPMLMFSGFFIQTNEVPVFLYPLPFLSYFRYAFEGMMQAVYGFGRPNLECSKPYCYYRSPSKYLEDLGMDQITYQMDMVALIIWMLFMQFCFYLALRWRIYKVCN